MRFFIVIDFHQKSSVSGNSTSFSRMMHRPTICSGYLPPKGGCPSVRSFYPEQHILQVIPCQGLPHAISSLFGEDGSPVSFFAMLSSFTSSNFYQEGTVPVAKAFYIKRNRPAFQCNK
jgi:hypothetical protein